IMEYLPGGTLASRLQRSRRSDTEVVALVRLLVRMLGRVHERGVFHGDIKPSNIGFAVDGSPRLLDFGLARALTSEDADDPGSDARRLPVGGTWAYLSPEVREGGSPGPMLDLWSLAVVLCEALLGEHPFREARTRQQLADAQAVALNRVGGTCSPSH